LRNCPAGAIIGKKDTVHVIDQAKCTKCGTCIEVCPARFGAVVKLSGQTVPVSALGGTKVIRKR
jgi:NADH-quinone oxidoreductase subunit F